ncbi:DUF2062 domain-containing protein [Adhaeribacter swui]|uniref:DUF2062 domain-containing protein n=1 Tax=Adhaeribacter swui TaxID=2086471 RepID=A0A7G7G941_9BACT|nr:DUF2062 domain-containing protein [Adhaeribacter swui]QNF33675.1 DUF2062 domain-containing protein [Adhaeribacter swui]
MKPHPHKVSYFRRKVVHPLAKLLTMGITPQRLAITGALGVVLGILPLFGLTSFLCTIIALRFRLNLPALLLICYLMGPLHLVLYIPFIEVGLKVFPLTTFNLSLSEITDLFKRDWQMALKTIWLANLAGILLWLVLAAPLTLFFYFLLLPVVRKLLKRKIVVED